MLLEDMLCTIAVSLSGIHLHSRVVAPSSLYHHSFIESATPL